MYLLDTNVISEARKGVRANPGVIAFRARILREDDFLPVQVVGELRHGIERLKARGDLAQAKTLEDWLESVLEDYEDRILSFDTNCAQVWGCLAPFDDQNPIDKQIASIALVYDLTVVTRNTVHFAQTGVRILNPFEPVAEPNPPDATPNPKADA